LKWLVDVHFCPVRIIHQGNKKNPGKVIENPLLTSKGRSVMSIAMEDNQINILRYLVVEKKMSIFETKDLNLALGTLDSVLKSPDPQSDMIADYSNYYRSDENNIDERDAQGSRSRSNSMVGLTNMKSEYDLNDSKTVSSLSDAVRTISFFLQQLNLLAHLSFF